MVIDLRRRDIVSKFIDVLKKDIFKDAVGVRLPILNDVGIVIGYLIPVGNWILESNELLAKISSWRNKFSRMFPTQNVVTIEGTKKYLGHLIKSSDAILFLIQDGVENIIGHIGIVNFNKKKCELAHLMRGENTKDTEIIYYAECALIGWASEFLNVELICIEVMSYNFGAISLHERVGFKSIKRLPIKKIITSDGIEHKVCLKEESNVNYSIANYELVIERPLIMNGQ